MTVELDRRKVLRMLAAAPVVPGALSQLLFACNNKKNDAGAAGAPGEKAEPFGDQKPAEIPWNGKRRHYDLIDNLSFASLRNEGLLVDFGTSDYLKYTLGGWRTGWGRFFLRDGVAYTHVVGVTTRLYFPWDRSEDLVVRFRAKPFGGDFFSLYMNNKDVQRVDLTKSDWNTYSVKIPASKVVAGENYMLMRWNSTEKVAGENLAAAMDHIHVVPASRAEEGGVLPTQTTISGKARSGKDEAPALLLASGMTLSYWVQVPEDEPLLGFNLGLVDASSGSADMKVRVTARADGSQPAELLSKTLSGEGSFTPEGIDLAGLGGKVVRLDVEATSPSSSQARAALVQPALFTKPIP